MPVGRLSPSSSAAEAAGQAIGMVVQSLGPTGGQYVRTEAFLGGEDRTGHPMVHEPLKAPLQEVVGQVVIRSGPGRPFGSI